MTSLAAGLKSTNLVSTVNNLKDVTIFGPSNAVFQAIAGPAASLSTAQFTNILEYHIIQGTIGYSALLSSTTLKSVTAAIVKITVGPDGSVFVNSARVVTPDVLVSNGVVHVIDK